MNERTKGWKVEEIDGVEWLVSPGVPWCAAGFRVRIAASARIDETASIGEGARIGARASIGDWASIGEKASIGAWASIGEKASIGEGARIGEGATIGAWASIGKRASIGERAAIGAWASIGERARIGERASIGEWASIGAKASFIADLGSYDGYRKVICSLEGIAYIGAGCRWFTLMEAKKHWHAKKKDRAITHAMLAVATLIAKQNKLKEGAARPTKGRKK